MSNEGSNNCKKGTTLMEKQDNEGGYACVGAGEFRGNL